MPDLYLDVTPLVEHCWTGIPVFTERLVRALAASGACALRFAYEGTEVEPELVQRAISWRTGVELRSHLDAQHPAARRPIPRGAALMYTSVKPRCGLTTREASVMHDLSTLLMPEFHEQSNVRYHLANLGRELGTNEITFFASEATRESFGAALKASGIRTDVLLQYVDWPEAFPAIAANDVPLALPPYFLLVGTLEPRKNIGVVLRAMALPGLRHLHCYVVGQRGWKVDEFLREEGIDDDVRDRVVFTGFISEYVKYRLLGQAQFLAFPSVFEGFGIPALEAMSLGVPVVASASSSLVEVIRDAGTFFDPFSPSGLAAAVAELERRKADPLFRESIGGAAARFGPAVMAAPVLRWLHGWAPEQRCRTPRSSE